MGLEELAPFLQETIAHDLVFSDDEMIDLLQESLNDLKKAKLDQPPPASKEEFPQIIPGTVFERGGNLTASKRAKLQGGGKKNMVEAPEAPAESSKISKMDGGETSSRVTQPAQNHNQTAASEGYHSHDKALTTSRPNDTSAHSSQGTNKQSRGMNSSVDRDSKTRSGSLSPKAQTEKRLSNYDNDPEFYYEYNRADGVTKTGDRKSDGATRGDRKSDGATTGDRKSDGATKTISAREGEQNKTATRSSSKSKKKKRSESSKFYVPENIHSNEEPRAAGSSPVSRRETEQTPNAREVRGESGVGQERKGVSTPPSKAGYDEPGYSYEISVSRHPQHHRPNETRNMEHDRPSMSGTSSHIRHDPNPLPQQHGISRSPVANGSRPSASNVRPVSRSPPPYRPRKQSGRSGSSLAISEPRSPSSPEATQNRTVVVTSHTVPEPSWEHGRRPPPPYASNRLPSVENDSLDSYGVSIKPLKRNQQRTLPKGVPVAGEKQCDIIQL